MPGKYRFPGGLKGYLTSEQRVLRNLSRDMSQPNWDSSTSGFSCVSKFCLDPGVEEAFLGLPALETRVVSLFGDWRRRRRS